MKNVTIVASIILLAASPTLSVEPGECNFARHLGPRLKESTNPSETGFFDVNHFVMESSALLFQRGRNESIPEIAQEYSFDSETKEAIVTINPNCRWSDGEPITAENFIDSFKMIFDPANETYNPGRSSFKNGADVWEGKLPFESLGVHAIDSRTLKFEMVAPESIFLAVLSYTSYTPAPSHILKNDPDYWDRYESAKIVSGPYLHQESNAEKTVLVRNPYYCNPDLQNFDHLTIYSTAVESEIGNLILDHKIDIAGRLPARLVKVLSNNKKVTSQFDLINVNDEVVYLFILNQDRIKDPEVRRAIGLALDYSYIESNTLGYFISVADSFAYRYEGYNPPKLNQNIDRYDVRLAEAREILNARGYTAENPLELDFKTSRIEIYQYLSQAISSMLSQLPIKLTTFKPTKTASIVSNKEETDIILSAWGSDYADPENFLTYMVKEFSSDKAKPSMINLLDQANNALTPEDRFNLLEQTEVELAKDQTVFPISWFKTVWMVKRNLEHNGGFYYLGRNFKRTDCDPQPLNLKG